MAATDPDRRVMPYKRRYNNTRDIQPTGADAVAFVDLVHQLDADQAATVVDSQGRECRMEHLDTVVLVPIEEGE